MPNSFDRSISFWLLKRFATLERSCLGSLSSSGLVLAFTLEPAYYHNTRMISAIPPGEYWLKKIIHPHFGKSFQVHGVPNRSGIFFHCGNSVDDTHGCILVGQTLDLSSCYLGRSRATMDSLHMACAPDVKLRIEDV